MLLGVLPGSHRYGVARDACGCVTSTSKTAYVISSKLKLQLSAAAVRGGAGQNPFDSKQHARLSFMEAPFMWFLVGLLDSWGGQCDFSVCPDMTSHRPHRLHTE